MWSILKRCCLRCLRWHRYYFCHLAGATGANLPTNVIIVLGLANLLADGFSMATGSYMGKRSQKQFFIKEKHDISQSIKQNPELLTAELTDTYQNKGISGKKLTQFVTSITKNQAIWLDEILMHRGITDKKSSPLLSGLITFFSFVVVGFIPLIPTIFFPQLSFYKILVLVALVLFAAGSLRSKITSVTWFRGRFEVMLAGIIASLIAFGVGESLANLLQ